MPALFFFKSPEKFYRTPIVYFWIYNEELEQGYLSNAVYRRMQKAAVALPDDFFAGGTPALHVYAFVQDAQGRCSETAYAGVAGFSGEAGFSGISGDSEFSGETVDTETGEIISAAPVEVNEGTAAIGHGYNPTDPGPL